MNNEKYKLFSTFDLNEREKDYLSDKFEFDYWKGEGDIPQKELKNKVKDIDVLLCYFMNDINEKIIDNAENLKVISTRTAGYNHINVKEANKNNIKVTKVSGPIAEGVAETTMGMIHSLNRGIHQGSKHVEQKKWNDLKEVWSNPWDLTLLKEKQIGIIGMGAIGKRLTEILDTYQTKIKYYNRSKKPEMEEKYELQYQNLEDLAKNSDILISAIPLNKETKHLINSKIFKAMDEESMFINISRGGVVKTEDLVKALKKNSIKRAAIDVYEEEPLPKDSKLFEIESNKLLMTPHFGGISKETTKFAKLEAAKNAYKALKGEKFDDLIN